MTWTSLILLVVFSGGSTRDAVSLIDAKDYFQQRKIPANVTKMVELARTEPKTGKAQIQQLLALRWLRENVDEVKKDKDFEDLRRQIEAIAKGQKAQDLHGFARDYATRTAIALGSSMKLVKDEIPKNSLSQDAIRWFPKETNMIFAVDFRFEGEDVEPLMKKFRDQIYSTMPPNGKEEFYSVLEQIGNNRLDRFAYGFHFDDQNEDNHRLFVRASGKMNQKWILDVIKQASPNALIQEEKSFRGRKVTLLRGNRFSPTMCFIGDDEVLMATNMFFPEDLPKEPFKGLQEMLAIRSGKKVGLLSGSLQKLVKDVSPRAFGLFAAELPEKTREEAIESRDAPFRVFPPKMVAEAVIKEGQIVLELDSHLDNAKDAKTFADDIAKLKEKGLKEIAKTENFPPGFPNVKKIQAGVKKTLNSLKVDVNGSSTSATITVDSGLQDPNLLGNLPFIAIGGGAGAPPPPPPEPKDEKGEKK